ncbi:Hpt domain-containing protein [Lachnospiraceae bacterium XBB2008]|nr:Hpt domain-containing protein [Lachnospiraceae bacterium XBB2008]
MYVLRALYIVLALTSVACIVAGAKQKRRNIGFLLTAGIIAVSDFLCAFLVGANNAKQAGSVLLPYYVLHAWFLFAMLIMIILIDRYRQFIAAVIISAGGCLYQTYLVFAQYKGARIFSFQKRVYFRKAWWVATDTKNTGFFMSFRSYRIMVYVNMLILMIVAGICIWYSHKVFRTGYISLIVMVLMFSVLESLTVHFTFPVWIPCIGYSVISLLCLYLTGDYPNNALREWSLDSFANDMSDGLILYDKHDDLIHINDMIRNSLDEELVEGFKDRSKLEAWIKDSMQEDENTGSVLLYSGRNRDYYIKVNERNLGDGRSSIGTLYILHDTTDSISRIKAMQEANEELERANRMKSDFLANMSHEIRTPMNAVLGMAEIALREDNPAPTREYLQQIQGSGHNLLNIINDILDYSKIESGKMEILEDDYEPFEEYLDITGILGANIGTKDLELFVLIESELPHVLRGDAMRIRQVLINLANNAIKFTPEGMVRIHIKCEPVSDDTVNMNFRVIDTGIGIKEEDLDKLFVSFQQVDSKRNRSVEGTGLGLAISQRLVEAMNGTIGVKSVYGEGSEFYFTIPQTVTDHTNDLTVENASGKKAYMLCTDDTVIGLFKEEMDRLGLSAEVLKSLDEYVPGGTKDYIFFVESRLDDELESFLKSHPAVNGIILAAMTSEFESDLPNLHIMRRPESTMAMVNTLNDRFAVAGEADDNSTFMIDFTAPDARLLAVDDNAINLTITEGLLAPLKVQLDKANGGQEAIDMVAANDYDIVLMDHMMPGIDGVDATRQILESKGDSGRPIIIALSANAMEEARRLFKEAGMRDFVAKPIDVRDLVTCIRRWLPPEKIVESDGSELAHTASDNEVKVKSDRFDTDNAVRALGSASLYDRIAEEYYLTGPERMTEIRTAYANEDWTDYTIKVHALKSSSRQIGAMHLGDLAETLEKAGKAGDIDKIRSDTDEALTEFDCVLEELAAAYGTGDEDDADKPLIDRDTLISIMDDLEGYCDILDMDGMEDVCSGLKRYTYEEDLRGLIDSLIRAIGDMDTEECMTIRDRIIGRQE